MKYSAVIFDFDYTLGDSTMGVVGSMNYAFTNLGYPEAAVDAISRTIGIALGEAFTILTGSSNPDHKSEFIRLFQYKADEIMTKESKLYPYTMDVLSRLKTSGVKTGIVTTKSHFRIDAILERYDASELVDIIVGGDEVVRAKPDPEALIKAVSALGIPNSMVLYIGDTVVDAMTARSAGVDFAAVTTGTTGKSEFSDYPSIMVADDLTQIFEVIKDRVG